MEASNGELLEAEKACKSNREREDIKRLIIGRINLILLMASAQPCLQAANFSLLLSIPIGRDAVQIPVSRHMIS